MSVGELNPEEKAVYARTVFLKLKKDDNGLKNGLKKREAMWEMIHAQRPPLDDYRYVWIIRSARVVLRVLQSIAYAFNIQHDDDKASVHDMVDILRYAAHFLKEQGKKS